jgi:glycosyltransferase involved in cell wall biosynthesis
VSDILCPVVTSKNASRPLRIGMMIVSEYEANPRIRRQAEALAARGDEVTVLALHAEGRPREDVVDGVRVVHAPTRKYRGDSARNYLSLYGGFFAHAARWMLGRPRAFDLVQSHTMPEAVIFAATLQRLGGVPVLLDVHDLTERLFASKFTERGAMMTAVRASRQLSLRFANEILTVHEPYAALIRAWTSKPVSIVMNAPDPRLFAPRPPRPMPADHVVFSYHGLIASRHGLVNAVEALAKLRNDVPGARLQILGSGDGLAELRHRVDDLGLGDAVSLPTRLLPITEMPAFLEQAHVGLVPSQRDPWTDEVLPTKLLEYAALGIPVITFRNPVIERYFPDDAVTYVDPASAENLLVAMRTLVADPARAQRQAQRAGEVVATMGWEQQKLAYFEVIDRMVARRAGSARGEGRT